MIITDSFGAPRKISHTVRYDETWPGKLYDFMLHSMNYSNFVFTKQGLFAKELGIYTRMKLDLYDKEYIFLQMGIVDCARRVFSDKAFRIVSMIPVVRNLIHMIAKKYHYPLTKLYKVVYTTPAQFEREVDQFIRTFENSRIFIIPILPTGFPYNHKSYDAEGQIREYNAIYQRLADLYPQVTYLDSIFGKFLPVDQENYMSDGYHISDKGHQIIFSELKAALTA